MSSEGRFAVQTQEQIELEFSLAGPGTRLCAAAIDFLILAILLIGIFLLWLALTSNASYFMDRVVNKEWGNWGSFQDWTFALIVIIFFVILTGYHLLFEILLHGQTPGKRYLKIRAIREDGTPMTITDALIRNLVRSVDFLPAFYLVGGIVCFLNPTHKRLGDLAAGTIVVIESEIDYRARTDKRYVLQKDQPIASNLELSPGERATIAGFLHRRTELLPESREQLGEKIAHSLFEKYGGQYIDPESYLERLFAGRHHEP